MAESITPPEEQYPAFKDRIVKARQAGFSDDAIRSSINNRVKEAARAGYSPEQINAKLGEIKGPSLTEGFIKPVAKELSTTAARIAPAVAGGLVGGIPGGMAGAAGGELLAQSLEQLYEGGKLDIAKYQPEQVLLSTVMGAIPGVEDIPGLPKITSQVGRLALRGGEAGTFGAAYDVASKAMRGEPITLKGAGQAFLSTAPFGIAMGGMMEKPSTVNPPINKPITIPSTASIKQEYIPPRRVEDLSRPVAGLARKETVGSLGEAITKEQESAARLRKSPKGAELLKQDLAARQSATPPDVALNINTAKLTHLQGQLDQLVQKEKVIFQARNQVRPDSGDYLTKVLQNNQAEQLQLKNQIIGLMSEKNELIKQNVEYQKGVAAVETAQHAQTIDNAFIKFFKDIEPHIDDMAGGQTKAIIANNLAQMTQKIKYNPGDRIDIGKIRGEVISTNPLITMIKDSKGNQWGVPTKDLAYQSIKDTAAEPVVNQKGHVESGKIPTSVESSKNTEQAESSIDAERINSNEIKSAEATINMVMEAKMPGLSRQYVSNEVLNELQAPIPPPESSGIGGGAAPPSTSSTNIFTTVSPTYQVAMNYEAKTGIPTFTGLVYSGQRTTREASKYSAIFRNLGEKVFGEYANPFRKTHIEGNDKITDILTNIKKVDKDITYKYGELERSGNINQAARDLNTTPELVRIATDLRKLYDDIGIRSGFIPFEQYQQYYSPRSPIRTDADIAKYKLDPRIDEMARQQYRRTGNLIPKVTSAWDLFRIYTGELTQAKALFPFEQYANPIINKIQDSPTKAYFLNYVNDVRNIPRHSYVDASARINTTIDNSIGMFDKMFGTAYGEHLKDYMGRNNLSGALVRGVANTFYKTWLGYRPTPTIKNMLNRLTAMPLVGEKGLITGRSISNTKMGQEEGTLSGILGPADELVERIQNERLKPMRRFQLEEDKNRLWTYLGKQKQVIDAYKNYQVDKNFDKAAKDMNLSYYPPVIQDRVKTLFEQGRVGYNKDIGISNNAAHFLADTTVFMSQVPVERGMKPELFRKSPFMAASGVFQNWNFMTGNYLYQMAKQVKDHPIQNKGLGLRLLRMSAYFAIADELYKQGTSALLGGQGSNLSSNPMGSSGIWGLSISGPVPTLAKDAVILMQRKVIGEWIMQQEDQYNKMEGDKAWREFKHNITAPAITIATGGRIPGGIAVDLYNKLTQ